MTDAGCSGAGQVCSVDDPDSCASGYACTLNSSGDVYTCTLSTDGGCDAGQCLTYGQTCSLSDPDNGGCEPGLYCEGQISSTGVFYTCSTGIDAG